MFYEFISVFDMFNENFLSLQKVVKIILANIIKRLNFSI